MVGLDVSDAADVVLQYPDSGCGHGQDICVWRTGDEAALSVVGVLLEKAKSG